MDPYDYEEAYADDGRYDDDPNPYHGDYSEEYKYSVSESLTAIDKTKILPCPERVRYASANLRPVV